MYPVDHELQTIFEAQNFYNQTRVLFCLLVYIFYAFFVLQVWFNFKHNQSFSKSVFIIIFFNCKTIDFSLTLTF